MPATKQCSPLYGQPITFTSALDSIGRYAIEANKPKVFADAVKMIGTSTGGQQQSLKLARKILRLSPQTAKQCAARFPSSKRTSAGLGKLSPAAVQLRLSGLGIVPASLRSEDRYGVISGYAKTARHELHRDSDCEVGREESGSHWTFGIEEGAAGAAAPTRKK